MKIEEISINDVIPYENNPRKNDGAVEAVANSIREFGFRVPIIIDRENVIIAGHTRLKAAEQLGLEKVPVVRADDLTEEQVRAFRLADNKVGEIAGWDFDLLAEELADISEIDMTDFGFEMPEDEEQTTAHDDDYDFKGTVEHRAAEGDVFALGEHRLMCGDSTSKADVEKLTGGGERRWSSPIRLTVWQSATRTKP